MNKNSYSKNKHCYDCGKLISNYAKQCKSCVGKTRCGKKAAHYIDGKSLKKHFCKCGKEIDYLSKKCTSCDNKRKHRLGLINNSGSNNGRWNGGSSFEPYSLDWTAKLREQIRKRDNHICQKCETKQNRKALDVHHIDYNKINCNKNNLITLCQRCNTIVNSNRDY